MVGNLQIQAILPNDNYNKNNRLKKNNLYIWYIICIFELLCIYI